MRDGATSHSARRARGRPALYATWEPSAIVFFLCVLPNLALWDQAAPPTAARWSTWQRPLRGRKPGRARQRPSAPHGRATLPGTARQARQDPAADDAAPPMNHLDTPHQAVTTAGPSWTTEPRRRHRAVPGTRGERCQGPSTHDTATSADRGPPQTSLYTNESRPNPTLAINRLTPERPRQGGTDALTQPLRR